MGIGGRDYGRVLRRCVRLTGAVLVAAVLFHDVAMASDAHAVVATDTSQDARAPRGVHASAHMQAEEAHVPAIHSSDEESCDPESCRPQNDCRVGLPGVLVPGANRLPLMVDIPVGGMFPAITAPSSLPGPVPDLTPPLPPGVRRALLQVFLI